MGRRPLRRAERQEGGGYAFGPGIPVASRDPPAGSGNRLAVKSRAYRTPPYNVRAGSQDCRRNYKLYGFRATARAPPQPSAYFTAKA